jgi:hypothetical protein
LRTAFSLSAVSKGEKTKPNKANGLKASRMSEMYEKFRKQSQATQTAYYQTLGAKNRPFFAKNEWTLGTVGDSRKRTQTKPLQLRFLE